MFYSEKHFWRTKPLMPRLFRLEAKRVQSAQRSQRQDTMILKFLHHVARQN